VRIVLAIAVVAAALLLASCATRAGPGAQRPGAAQVGSNTEPPRDRSFSGVGRQIRSATPGPVRRGLHNVLQNSDEPVVAMNDVLQGRLGTGGRTLVRFVINSTVGLVGLFDPARKAGLPHHDNGFASTLGRYGVPAGPSLHLPLLGSLTVREAVGGAVDFVSDPVGLVPYHGAQNVNIARTALGLVYDPEHEESHGAEPPLDERSAASAEAPSPPPVSEASATDLPPF
jgi:hypothetical protein